MTISRDEATDIRWSEFLAAYEAADDAEKAGVVEDFAHRNPDLAAPLREYHSREIPWNEFLKAFDDADSDGRQRVLDEHAGRHPELAAAFESYVRDLEFLDGALASGPGQGTSGVDAWWREIPPHGSSTSLARAIGLNIAREWH